jgi:uroporphyrinogen-III synthase
VSLRVALTRPIEDARRSAAALRARGFEPVLAPAIEIAPSGTQPPHGDYDSVLATSANAFTFLPAETLARLSGLKLHVAGERTAAVARAMGFGAPETTSADAATLAASLAARSPFRFLYLAGRDRKPTLESTLRAAGHHVVATEVYAAEARDAWSAEEVEALATCGAALHYSRRSAELAIGLAERAGVGDHWRGMLHACLSADAAEPLRLLGAQRIVVAMGAQEPLLIEALEHCVTTTLGGSAS